MKIQIRSRLRPLVVGQASRLSSCRWPPLSSGGELDRRDACPTNESGSITLIFVVLLTIMLILVTAEVRALHHLHREVKFLEQQQVKRLAAPTTNTVAVTTPPTK